MKRLSPSAKTFFALVGVTAWALLQPSVAIGQAPPWNQVDEGLWVAEFDASMKSNAADPIITVIRVDPKRYAFKLLCASEHGRIKMTAKQWCEKFNLIGAVNAGMYQQDGFTNVGLMKNYSHTNNSRLNNVYKAVLAFNPTEPKIPEIQIIDLKCQDFESIGPKYQTLIQNIRMISCRQENVWVNTYPIRGMAVFGMDKSGNALLVFSGVPYSGHDFANTLLSLPLSIFSALYLEGGFEANLSFSWKGVEIEKVGARETGLREESPRAVPRPIPNVIGISRKGQ